MRNWVKYKIFGERDHIHVTFITTYYYNYSILLLISGTNLFLYLIYKLNYVIDMYV